MVAIKIVLGKGEEGRNESIQNVVFFTYSCIMLPMHGQASVTVTESIF